MTAKSVNDCKTIFRYRKASIFNVFRSVRREGEKVFAIEKLHQKTGTKKHVTGQQRDRVPGTGPGRVAALNMQIMQKRTNKNRKTTNSAKSAKTNRQKQ